MPKKMYVVRTELGSYWCGLGKLDDQLRKAQIFHSLKYANDIVERLKEYNPKIVEIYLKEKPEINTLADRIRAMTDEELAKLLLDGCRGSKCEDQPQNEFGSVNCFDCRMKWLQQPGGE